MARSVASAETAGKAPETAVQPPPGAGRLRAGLVIGCILAAALAAWVGDPQRYHGDDAQLGRLLRGLGAVKGIIALGAVAVLSWRFGHPVPARVALAYIAGACLIAGASALVLQLSFIPAASGMFWAGIAALLVGVWGDRRA
jgi:small-conductance mechanosensitive channel